jgi:hypothetical protein
MTWRDDLAEAAAYEAQRAAALKVWTRRLLAGEDVPKPWETPPVRIVFFDEPPPTRPWDEVRRRVLDHQVQVQGVDCFPTNLVTELLTYKGDDGINHHADQGDAAVYAMGFDHGGPSGGPSGATLTMTDGDGNTMEIPRVRFATCEQTDDGAVLTGTTHEAESLHTQRRRRRGP